MYSHLPFLSRVGVHTHMTLEEAKKQKKISCHFKLTPWHRDKLVRIAKAARRDMTSIVEELIEKAK